MKKILLIALLCISSLTFSQTFDFDGLSYSINTDDPTTVTVTGQTFGSTVLDLVIPEIAINDANVSFTVTSIGNSAFAFNQLTSVTIPNSVTTIGGEAFTFNQLTSVIIGNSVTTIGYDAFRRNQLTSVTIPNSVTTIGDDAFRRNQLTSVTIPNSVTTIGEEVFRNNQLTSVTIPNSVTSIGFAAFRLNQLTSVIIPNSVTTIEDEAFQENQLTSVTIGNSVTTIGDEAFQFTNPLLFHNIYFLGSTPPTIQANSFIGQNSAPNRFEILVTVQCSINYLENPLYTDFFIQGFDVASGFTYIQNTANQSNATITGRLPTNTTTDLVIPETLTVCEGVLNVTTIEGLGIGAFQENQLTSVTIPNSVTTIGGVAFLNNQLTSVTIPNSVTTIGSAAFAFNQLTSVTIPNSVTTIGGEAFAFNQLTSVTIPNSVTTIEFGVFENNQLTSVTIPNSVTTIENNAFLTNQLTSVTMGNSVTSIGNAFQFANPTNPNSGEHSLTFLGNTPPTIIAASFINQIFTPNRQDISVTVPCAALTTYTNNSLYTGFFDISCATIWNNASWSDGAPTLGIDALIAEDYNTLTNGAINATTLEIQSGYTLSIADNTFIQTQSDIIVNGTLDIANAGSVVQIDDDALTVNNGSITVTKTTPILDDRNFVAMSSPVTAEARDRVYGNSRAVFSIIPQNFVPFMIDFVEFPEFEFSENFLDDNNDYLLLVTGSTALPNAGIGQLIFPQPEPNVGDGAYTLTYTQDAMHSGTLNSGTITVPINYNGPATTNNYNLLGNPYASAIDVTAFINANDAVNEVYYWDHITMPSSDLPGFGTSNFSMNDISIRNAMMGIAAVNGGTEPGQFMASGQGFGIKADQVEMVAGTPVVFTNSIRVTGNNDGFRSSETANNLDKFWLNLTTTAFEEAISQTGIGFSPNASVGYDSGYDSARLGTFLSLFTTLETGEYLSIQGREAFDADMEITLGFSSTIEENTSYTIALNKLEGIHLEETPVFLIDNLLETVTSLKEASYSFTSERGIQPDRFTIVFKEREVLSTDEESFRESEISLYPNPSQDQVTLAYSGNSTLENAVITDINGKIIKRIHLNNFDQSKQIDIDNLATGMYFITMTSQENSITKKLIKR